MGFVFFHLSSFAARQPVEDHGYICTLLENLFVFSRLGALSSEELDEKLSPISGVVIT